jgi:hypothetical protein
MARERIILSLSWFTSVPTKQEGIDRLRVIYLCIVHNNTAIPGYITCAVDKPFLNKKTQKLTNVERETHEPKASLCHEDMSNTSRASHAWLAAVTGLLKLLRQIRRLRRPLLLRRKRHWTAETMGSWVRIPFGAWVSPRFSVLCGGKNSYQSDPPSTDYCSFSL